MKLSDLTATDFGPFSDLEIEDTGFFLTMTQRMIEDLDLVVHSVAAVEGQTEVDKDLMSRALALIDSTLSVQLEAELDINGSGGGNGGYAVAVREQITIEQDTPVTFEATPTQFVVAGLRIEDFARAPLSHRQDAIKLLTKFVNFQILTMLRHAAVKCEEEGATRIKLRHYLPWCEEWPYPLNRYC